MKFLTTNFIIVSVFLLSQIASSTPLPGGKDDIGPGNVRKVTQLGDASEEKPPPPYALNAASSSTQPSSSPYNDDPSSKREFEAGWKFGVEKEYPRGFILGKHDALAGDQVNIPDYMPPPIKDNSKPYQAGYVEGAQFGHTQGYKEGHKKGNLQKSGKLRPEEVDNWGKDRVAAFSAIGAAGLAIFLANEYEREQSNWNLGGGGGGSSTSPPIITSGDQGYAPMNDGGGMEYSPNGDLGSSGGGVDVNTAGYTPPTGMELTSGDTHDDDCCENCCENCFNCFCCCCDGDCDCGGCDCNCDC